MGVDEPGQDVAAWKEVGTGLRLVMSRARRIDPP
jgi:hypothetical protein